MPYERPQVKIFRSSAASPTVSDNGRRPLIVGPNVIPHRYSVPAERVDIGIGPYDHTTNRTYLWPNKASGSIVSPESVKLWVKNGLLQYFQDLIGEGAGDLGLLAPVAGKPNWVTHAEMRWKTNGPSVRSSLLGDRDVQIGDVVRIRGVEDPSGTCIERILWTTVAGFSSAALSAVTGAAYFDAANPNSTTAGVTTSFTAGQANCVEISTDNDIYLPLPSGVLTETYTVTVAKSSVSGCTAARLRVTSASGTDNVGEIAPAAFGQPTAIGTRGTTVTFAVSATVGCGSAATTAGLPTNEFIVGQTWTVVATGAYVKAEATSGGVYTGLVDDTYIIEVTRGGLFAALPRITVTTARGADVSGPTVVSAVAAVVPIGTQGLTVLFDKVGAVGAALTGLRKGDKFYVQATSSASGPIRTLILRDNLPTGLASVTDMDIALYVPATFEILANRYGHAPSLNYSLDGSTGVTVNAGVLHTDARVTVSSVPQELLLYSGVTSVGGTDYGQLYLEYAENLSDLTGTMGRITSPAELSSIPGPLEPINALKWGVHKSLIGAGAAGVAYIAVANPDVVDSWVAPLALVEGRADAYNYVPLTFNETVQNLYFAQAVSESAPEVANYKGVLISALYKEVKRVVGNTLALATVADNPSISGTQYTLMTIAGATLLTSGVRAGDQIRYLYTTDGFSGELYTSFVVASVLSETSLLLTTPTVAAISVPQKVEVWHKQSKDEIVADLVARAGSFGSERCVLCAPDAIYEGGVATPGYFGCAAVAGVIAGVEPHQGLTNYPIAGLTGVAERTRDYFKASQLDALSGGGVWTITADRTGAVYTRHAVTTRTGDLKYSEEMIRRNYDSISYDMVNLLRPYIGKTNATQTVLDKLEYDIRTKLERYSTIVTDTNLGPRLLSGAISRDANGAIMLRVHPLAKDRIEIHISIELPAPGNHIDLYIVA